MSSPVRPANSSEDSVSSFPNVSRPKLAIEPQSVRGAPRLAAYSFEFVAKPEQAAGARLLLPAAIQSGLQDLPGFAGSLVMVSDMEARLITVIILWEGGEARKTCTHSVRRVRALLAPYLDRCLRVQNLLAHLPMQQNSQASSIDARFIPDESIAQEANVCVA